MLENKPRILYCEDSVEQYMDFFAFQSNVVMDNWLQNIALRRGRRAR